MSKDTEPQGETPSPTGSDGAGYRARTDDIQLGKVTAEPAGVRSSDAPASNRALGVPFPGDRVELLNDGELVEHGTVGNLYRDSFTVVVPSTGMGGQLLLQTWSRCYVEYRRRWRFPSS